MMASSTISRIASSSARAIMTTRPPQQMRLLSTQGTVAVEKLREALEDYRAVNYKQALRSRFKKDIVQAAKLDERSDAIGMEGLQRVLANIDMQHRISEQEMKLIFEEIGGDSGKISVDSMLKII